MSHRSARVRREDSAHLIKGCDETSAVVVGRDLTAGCFEYLRQIGSPEIGHAEDAQPAGRIIGDGVNRHDVRVLKSREDLRLFTVGTRDLDGDQPPAQVDFLGEIDPGKSPSAQLEDDPETRQLIAGVGEPSIVSRPTGPRLDDRALMVASCIRTARTNRAATGGLRASPDRPRFLELEPGEKLDAIPLRLCDRETRRTAGIRTLE
jgi:hypothetical protein